MPETCTRNLIPYLIDYQTQKEILLIAPSVVDLYRDILPKTNCRDCGFSTCLAFASMVVSEHPFETAPICHRKWWPPAKRNWPSSMRPVNG
ncbi:MAG: (Fe-S)-binding protein [Desulfobacterales bacterium]